MKAAVYSASSQPTAAAAAQEDGGKAAVHSASSQPTAAAAAQEDGRKAAVISASGQPTAAPAVPHAGHFQHAADSCLGTLEAGSEAARLAAEAIRHLQLLDHPDSDCDGSCSPCSEAVLEEPVSPASMEVDQVGEGAALGEPSSLASRDEIIAVMGDSLDEEGPFVTVERRSKKSHRRK